jgi:reactive intermediate/imine deaminase
MARQVFRTSGAPAPVAQYSQAAQVGSLVAVAGQVGIDAATGEVAGPGVAEQTTQALANADAALRAAGLTFDDVVRMDCYVTDEADMSAFNAAYAAWFPTDPPARTTVVVGLMQGLKVEVTALAVAS